MPIHAPLRGLLLGSLASLIWGGEALGPTFTGVDPALGQRGDKATGGGQLRFFKPADQMAQPLFASVVPGTGSEWFVGAGFLADGSLVLVGNALGGDLAFPGVQLTAIPAVGGAEPPQPTTMPARRTDPRRGNQPLGPSWLQDPATGLVVVLDPTLKRVQRAVRLPWGSGAITAAAVAADGSIFITGRSGAAVAALGGEELPVDPEAQQRKGGAATATFTARIDPQLSRIAWAKRTNGRSDAPTLRLLPDGHVLVGAQDLRTYAPDGKLVRALVVPGGVKETTSVSPKDGRIVRGGEHHWHTGREPYRCPILNVFEPDGTMRDELYHWPGPFIGLDNNRLVSDTAVRAVTHDADGNIIIYAWSDGGNSVMGRQPTDLWRWVGTAGVGLNASGANATSFAYLVKIEPVNYGVIGWTMWAARYGTQPPKANGAILDTIHELRDGSLAFTGGSAWGLYQTSNRISFGEPAGQFLAIINSSFNQVRYSSAMPGTAYAEPADDRRWGIAEGVVQGRRRAVFVCGAQAEEDVYDLKTPVPSVNGLGAYGGGWSDGYVAIFDVGPAEAPKAPAVAGSAPAAENEDEAILAGPVRIGIERYLPQPDRSGQITQVLPAEDSVWFASAENPGYVSADIEFRDRDGKRWPSLAFGRPAQGSYTWADQGFDGGVSLNLSEWCQPEGRQEPRTLGALAGPATSKPRYQPIRIEMGDIAPLKERQISVVRNKKTVQVASRSSSATMAIMIGERRVSIPVEVAINPSMPREPAVRDHTALTDIKITAIGSFPAKDLGLSDLGPAIIDVRCTYMLVRSADKPPKRKKKKK